MAYSVEPVSPFLEDRDDLVAFLMNSPGTAYSAQFWNARLRHWWDDNPAASPDSPRGWVLRFNEQIVGFLGCVPVRYSFDAKDIMTVAASSWRVLEAHRAQSLRLFMLLFKLSQTIPVLNTTPNEAVMQILERSGFHNRSNARQHFFLMNAILGPLVGGVLGKRCGYPKLASQTHLVTSISEVKGILSPVMQTSRLEKMVTVESLRWQLSTSTTQLHLVGCVDEEGILSSYMILQEACVKGVKAWTTVDWFTCRSSSEEIHALVGRLCRQPGLIPGNGSLSLLIVTCLDDADFWSSAPAIFRRNIPALHYYSLPKTLGADNKRCVLAEGDCYL